MIHLPPDYIITSTLEVGSVYYFSAPEHISTVVPHYFFVVGRDKDDNYMIAGTSQKEKQEAYIKHMKFDSSSLVCIKPDEENGLKKNTYLNCNNECIPLSKEDLVEKVKEGNLSYTGKISKFQYDQVRNGIETSPTNDLPTELLVHPKDDEEAA